eukprot:751332-Pelagomonas_calceolata.AAC.1
MAPPTTGLNTGGLPRKVYKGRGKNNFWVTEQYVKQVSVASNSSAGGPADSEEEEEQEQQQQQQEQDSEGSEGG